MMSKVLGSRGEGSCLYTGLETRLLQDQCSTMVFAFLPYPLRCGPPSQVCSLF